MEQTAVCVLFYDLFYDLCFVHRPTTGHEALEVLVKETGANVPYEITRRSEITDHVSSVVVSLYIAPLPALPG
jgi:hypothetical protein